MNILPAVVVLFFAFDEKKNPDADILQQLEILKYTHPMQTSLTDVGPNRAPPHSSISW